LYVFLTCAQIFITYYYPTTTGLVTRLFNLGGWLIAAAGMVDCGQLVYVIGQKVDCTVQSTNKKTLSIMCFLVYPSLVATFIALFMTESELLPYRIVSIVMIIAEAISFGCVLWVIRKSKSFLGQVKYFAFTIICRFGILIGIVVGMLEVDKLVVNIIHFVSVLFIIVAMKLIGQGISMTREKKGLTKSGFFSAFKSRIASKVGLGSRFSTASKASKRSKASKVSKVSKVSKAENPNARTEGSVSSTSSSKGKKRIKVKPMGGKDKPGRESDGGITRISTQKH